MDVFIFLTVLVLIMGIVLLSMGEKAASFLLLGVAFLYFTVILQKYDKQVVSSPVPISPIVKQTIVEGDTTFLYIYKNQ